MRNLKWCFFMIFYPFVLIAQGSNAFDQISVGNSYTNQTYYKVSDGSQSTISLESWDLAFSVFDDYDAGIHYNEGAALNGAIMELFEAPNKLFSDNIGLADLDTLLLNEEISWNEGAFNRLKDDTNGNDRGWGLYDGTQVIGNRVFVLKLRDESYKKIFIQHLNGGSYQFKYANLDGTNEVSHSINKANHNGKTLAYYSITNNEEVDIEPLNWDLLFTRYTTLATDGMTFIEYNLTGVLSNEGIRVAQANNVDVNTVNYSSYSNDFTSEIKKIGHDWKTFNQTFLTWSIEPDRAYFLKDENQQVWKLVFIDFEGSSTGTTTIEKELVGTLTTTENPMLFSEILLAPNPTQGDVQLIFSQENNSDIQVDIFNALGQKMHTFPFNGKAGLNVIQLESLNLPSGIYSLSLTGEGSRVTKQLVVVE